MAAGTHTWAKKSMTAMCSEWRPERNNPKSEPLMLPTSVPSVSTMATLFRAFLSITDSASSALSVA